MRPTPEPPETGLPDSDPKPAAPAETVAPPALPEPAAEPPRASGSEAPAPAGEPPVVEAAAPPPVPPAGEAPAAAIPAVGAAPAATCPQCGASSPDPAARFCPYDGSPLGAPPAPRVCTLCGRPAGNDEKFCVLDGHAIGDAVKAGGVGGRVNRAGGFFDRAGHKADELMKTGYAVHIGRYLSRAWDYFKDYPLGYLGFGAVLAITTLTVIGIVLLVPMAAGVSWVARKQRRGEKPQFSDFFHGFNRFGPLFIGGLLALLFMALGVFTCGVLTVYLAVAYLFFTELILFKGLDFGEALETSRKIIHKQWFEMFIFALVLALILTVVGVVTSGLAVAFCLPFVLLATHAAYEEIVGYD